MPIQAAKTDLWFRSSPKGVAEHVSTTLICFPHAGGGASAYRHWQAALQESAEVLAVQYPGHEGRWREPLAGEVRELAEPLAEAISARAYPDVVLFGHSLGAFVAFEVARTIRRKGRKPPKHLFVSGSRAPDACSLLPPIHNTSDDVFLNHMRSYGGVPEEVLAHSQLMELLIPVLRADMRLDETYRYAAEPPLDCRITVFVGLHDEHVSLEHAQQWHRHTRGECRLLTFPAGHWWPADCERTILSNLGTECADRYPAASF